MNSLFDFAKELNVHFKEDVSQKELALRQTVKLQEEVGEVAEAILGEFGA